jgi:quercetin dioxygenase-like cupin family protein
MSEALSANATFDELEAAIAASPQIHLPVTHRFAPGLYLREITIPKDSLLTSMEHLTEHFFVILEGKIEVHDHATGTSEIISAGHIGRTMPGTRRALHALEDTRWATMHPTQETDPEVLTRTLVKLPDNPLMPPDYLPGCLKPFLPH